MTELRSIPLMIEVHAEEAAILWLRRNAAVNAPHYNRMFLGRLDERLEANIDGLRIAGEAGWVEAQRAFAAHPEPGEAFVLATLAFGREDLSGINDVLDVLGENAALVRPIAAALGWLKPSKLRGKVQSLFNDPRPRARELGLAACSTHRVDPGDQLAGFLDDVPSVAARALRLAGELGRSDLCDHLRDTHADPDCRFRSAWSRVLLGDPTGLADLQDIALADGPNADMAFELAVSAMDGAAARSWFKTLTRDTIGLRQLIKGAGLTGDPTLVPWLCAQMEDPAHAALAGESLSLITGADLEYLDLDGDRGEVAGPDDNPASDRVDLDVDDDLPMPDPARVTAWWEAEKSRYPTSQRCFLGKPRGEAAFAAGFEKGYQRQRRAAALNLALLSPQAELPNWRKRVFMQDW